MIHTDRQACTCNVTTHFSLSPLYRRYIVAWIWADSLRNPRKATFERNIATHVSNNKNIITFPLSQLNHTAAH